MYCDNTELTIHLYSRRQIVYRSTSRPTITREGGTGREGGREGGTGREGQGGREGGREGQTH